MGEELRPEHADRELDAAPEVAAEAKHFEPQGGMLDLYESTALESLCDGPAGTGKTRGIMELCHFMCMNWPRARFLWAMAERATMTETVLATFEELVLPDGCPLLEGPSRAQRRTYDYPNGSKIILHGLLDNPQKTRSMEVDWAVVFEATNTTEESVLMLLRALRWGALPTRRLILETNPGPPQHWILQRCLSGKMARFPSKHTDNPRFWDARRKRWTPDGEFYVENVLNQYTGVMRQRLKDGLWVADDRSVFDLDILLAHRNEHGEEPWHVGTLVHEYQDEPRMMDESLRRKEYDKITWKPAPPGVTSGPGAEWKLWCDLFPDRKTGKFRPDQGMMPVQAADVSWGQGASNSVIAAGDRNTSRKFAEYASALHGPEDFARMLAMSGLWFGGPRGCAFTGWEYNGPGASVTKVLGDDISYPWCYEHRSRKTGKARTGDTPVLGWVSNRQSKIDLALELRDAYRKGEFVNPSKAAIDETMTWVRYKNGGIGPASLAEESAEAQATHGDRGVADMLLQHLMPLAPTVPMRTKAEPGSIKARQEAEEREREDEEG